MESNAAKNLVEKLRACLGRESVAIADFLELLRDFDHDRAWLHLSFPSLFEFCCEVLGLTPAEAANRIRLMHLATLIPNVLPALRARRISPTGLRLIAPLLTPENFEGLLSQVQGLSTRQIEAFAQERQAAKPLPPPVSEETPEYRYHFTMSEEQRSRLERVKELASHRCDPNKLASVLELLMEDFLDRHDPARKQSARTKQVDTPDARNTPKEPATSLHVHNRRIPAAIRREVHVRDGGQCTHVDPTTGRRCSARRYLHIDHIVPFACGGSSTDPRNLRLLCPAHNRLAADAHFGKAFMEEKIYHASTSRDANQQLPQESLRQNHHTK